MFTDSREALVEASLQVLCVTMENDLANQNVSVDGTAGGTAMEPQAEVEMDFLTKPAFLRSSIRNNGLDFGNNKLQ